MSKYKVGDKVRVRKWEEMEKEFGLDEDGDIKLRTCFARDMKVFCGKTVTISDMYDEKYKGKQYIIEEDSGKWNWSDDMFKSAEFCLDDLKDENIIEIRCGEKLVVLGEYFVNNNGYVKKKDYYQDFKNKNLKEWDIVAAYPPSGKMQRNLISMTKPVDEPIWKEKKRIEIPEPDRTILDNLYEEYQWIARDEDGEVDAYSRKPEKHDQYWTNGGQLLNLSNIFDDLFQFIQWTDEEPINFRELLRKEKENK